MLATVITLTAIALADPPERSDPPSKEQLAAITARGRLLAGYDAAAWHASDAVRARMPEEGSVVRYIARTAGKGWTVAFGRLDQKRDKFLIAYEATQGDDPMDFAVKAFDPPKEDVGFYRSAARAIDVALEDFTAHFEGAQRPYNVAVLPAEEGQFWVYLVPAPTKPNVWPLGGDVRYLLSADGTRIVSKRQLHTSVIEVERPQDGTDQPVAGVHTHVLDDTPEDTDVFHVLVRRPSVPEFIVTRQSLFAVEVDGALKYLGKPEDVLRK